MVLVCERVKAPHDTTPPIRQPIPHMPVTTSSPLTHLASVLLSATHFTTARKRCRRSSSVVLIGRERQHPLKVFQSNNDQYFYAEANKSDQSQQRESHVSRETITGHTYWEVPDGGGATGLHEPTSQITNPEPERA